MSLLNNIYNNYLHDLCNFKKTIPADLEAQLASLREGVSLLSNNKQQVIDTSNNNNNNNNNNNLILIMWYDDDDDMIMMLLTIMIQTVWFISELHFCLKFLNNIYELYSETWITAVLDNATYVVKNLFGFWVSQVTCYSRQL